MDEVDDKDVILDYKKSSDTFYLYHNPKDEKVTGNLVFRDGPIVDIGKNGIVLGLSVDNASEKLKISPDQLKYHCEGNDLEKAKMLFKRALEGYIDVIRAVENQGKSFDFYSVKIFK